MNSSRAGISLAVAGAGLLVAGCSATVSPPNTGDAQTEQSGQQSAQSTEVEETNVSMRSLAPTEVQVPPRSGGLPPVIRSVKTNDKVVFLTFDDGYSDSAKTAKILRKFDVPVTSFLTQAAISSNRDYFQALSEQDGQAIQNHTINHPSLPGLDQAGQENQICATSDAYAKWTGTRPWMLRPPYGSYNETTRAAAAACGIDYIVNWNVSLPAGHLRYAAGSQLQSGDIILSHWRDDLPRHLKRALRDIRNQGFKIGALQDYLPPR